MYAIRSYYVLAARQTLLDRAVRDLETIGSDLAAALGREISEREEIRQRVVPPFAQGEAWGEIRERVRELARETERLGRTLRELLKASGALPEAVAEKVAGQLTDLRGVTGRIEAIAGDLVFFVGAEAAT